LAIRMQGIASGTVAASTRSRRVDAPSSRRALSRPIRRLFPPARMATAGGSAELDSCVSAEASRADFGVGFSAIFLGWLLNSMRILQDQRSLLHSGIYKVVFATPPTRESLRRDGYGCWNAVISGKKSLVKFVIKERKILFIIVISLYSACRFGTFDKRVNFFFDNHRSDAVYCITRLTINCVMCRA